MMELPESPYSDYWVKARDQKTPAALADAAVAKLIGKLDVSVAAP